MNGEKTNKRENQKKDQMLKMMQCLKRDQLLEQKSRLQDAKS